MWAQTNERKLEWISVNILAQDLRGLTELTGRVTRSFFMVGQMGSALTRWTGTGEGFKGDYSTVKLSHMFSPAKEISVGEA